MLDEGRGIRLVHHDVRLGQCGFGVAPTRVLFGHQVSVLVNERSAIFQRVGRIEDGRKNPVTSHE